MNLRTVKTVKTIKTRPKALGSVNSDTEPNCHREFIRRLIFIESKQAQELLSEYLSLEFEQATHGQIGTLEYEIEWLESQLTTLKTEQADLNKRIRATPRFLRRSSEVSSDSTVKRSVSWKDKLLIGANFIGLGVCFGASWTNVFSNLLASSLVYQERPYLAGILAMLAPCGALALKALSGFFDLVQSKKRYSLIVYCCTAAMLLVWIALFAMTNNGASGALDLDALLDASNGTKGSLLVWATLMSEILIGSSLALSLDQIYAKISPDHWEENQEHHQLQKVMDDVNSKIQELTTQMTAAVSKLTALRSQQKVQILEGVLTLTAEQEKFQRLQEF